MNDERMPDGALCDEDSETRVLGSCLQAGHLVARADRQLVPGDFYQPSHRWLFDLLIELHRDGRDGVQAVINEIKSRRPERPTVNDVYDLEMRSPGTSEGPFDEAVRQVFRYSIYRQVANAGTEIRNRALTVVEPSEDLMEFAMERIAKIKATVSSADQIADLTTYTDLLDQADTVGPVPWVIPGLLRRGWRAMIVAQEGQGKSQAVRQIAITAAQGIHPFRFTPIPPVRTLLVDLENPSDSIADGARPIVARAKLMSEDYQPFRAWVWHQPGGIDIRTRVGRGQLEAVIANTQPDLVCLGPVYKAYRIQARESDEIAAGEVQVIFDDLRTRYDFALVLEHHAPKAQGTVRDMLPYGSSLWLRWPELGIKFVPLDDPPDAVTVGRFRFDRVKNSWPNRLDRGGEWPWTGWWTKAPDDDFEEF